MVKECYVRRAVGFRATMVHWKLPKIRPASPIELVCQSLAHGSSIPSSDRVGACNQAIETRYLADVILGNCERPNCGLVGEEGLNQRARKAFYGPQSRSEPSTSRSAEDALSRPEYQCQKTRFRLRKFQLNFSFHWHVPQMGDSHSPFNVLLFYIIQYFAFQIAPPLCLNLAILGVPGSYSESI
jgi:hypothetical protein